MYLLTRAIANLRDRGVVHTVRVGLSVLADASFDWHHGTDTRGRIRHQDLDLPSRNRASAMSYRPSKAAPLRRLLRQLDLPRHGTFVDFGSGKGRVLIIAAQRGFSRVIGVELSHDLCVIARCNVDLVERRTKVRLPIEIVEADVTEFCITPDQNVFFLFNPFTTDVMAPVLQHIQASILAHPRPIWLIYSTPCYDEAIMRAGLFAQRRNYAIHASEFAVFAP